MGNILRFLKAEPTDGFKVGDLIECNSLQDMIVTDYELVKAGYETGYAYRVNGEKGLWIEIRGVKNEKGLC